MRIVKLVGFEDLIHDLIYCLGSESIINYEFRQQPIPRISLPHTKLASNLHNPSLPAGVPDLVRVFSACSSPETHGYVPDTEYKLPLLRDKLGTISSKL